MRKRSICKETTTILEGRRDKSRDNSKRCVRKKGGRGRGIYRVFCWEGTDLYVLGQILESFCEWQKIKYFYFNLIFITFLFFIF